MTSIKTLLIAACASTLMIAGSASAKDATFNASFSLDKNASVQAQYESFRSTAKQVCASEIRRAGYRKTESVSAIKRKCERQLIKRAVKATKNRNLIAFHNFSVNPVNQDRQYARK